MSIVVDRARLTAPALTVVQRAVSALTDVAQVATFARNQYPPLHFARKVTFADGSFDLVAMRPSDAHLFVFSATPGGRVVATTIWGHRPSESELAEARMAHGLAVDATPAATA